MNNTLNREIGNYIINNNATLRQTAEHFGMSRQAISQRMKTLNDRQVNMLLQEHFESKYIRGGIANKKRFEKI